MADAAAALQWDLVPRMSPYLDRHLVLPLLEHLEAAQVRLCVSSIFANAFFGQATERGSISC